jgi:hypothetical protein
MLTLTTLPELWELNMGGGYLMATLVDSLHSKTLDVEARDPIEGSTTNLLARSNHLLLMYLMLRNATQCSAQCLSSPAPTR